jgi:PAS domain S-box-containing protein
MLEIPVISLALFLVAALIIGLAVYAFSNIKVRGALEFSLLMVSLTLYIAGFGFEILNNTREGILFWLKIEYLGISTIPLFCILLAIKLAGNAEWLKWWPLRVFLAVPVLTLLVYFTNDWHHLFYKNIGGLEPYPAIPWLMDLVITKGIWYYVNIIYLNLALLAAFILFVGKLKKESAERRQAWILICGALGPWMAHLVYQAGMTRGFDISPFGFLLTAPLFAVGVFGNYVVFLLPKARNAVYQSFRDGVLIVDNQKNLIDYNRTAGNVFRKLNRTLIGKKAAEIFASEPVILELIKGADNQRIQAKFNIDNVGRTFILTSSVVRSRKNDPLGIIVVMHETTDQVFLLDNLRESEEKHRLIFEHAPVGIIQYDAAGRITTCNDAFVEIIGSSREVLIGLNMLNLPDTLMTKVISDSLNGLIGYYEHEYHSVTALKVTPVRGFFAPITAKDGQIRGGVGIVEDFTERYLADQKIRSREEFENILITLELDFLNSGLDEMDDTFNRGLISLGEYCKVDRACICRIDLHKKTIGMTHEWCSPGVRAGLDKHQGIPFSKVPKLMERLKKSETVYLADLSEFSPEWQSEIDTLELGRIKSWIVVPIEIGGELLGFAGFDSIHEVRVWNKDEIALLQVLGHIFASVIKRKQANEELVLARDRSEEANRVKSTFLANMSHEIRTPLNGILGFAELLQSESEDSLVKKYSEIIISSGNRLLQTLSQILDLSRVEAGKIDLVIEAVNVNRAIDDVIYLFTPTANKKGLFIERQPGGVNMILKLDDQLFRNSLTNLISNAIKFTKQGGITISTAAEVVNGKRFGLIRVSDTGIGIPENYFDSIFEDFKQVSEGVKRNYEGTGLGLSLTKKFVQLSGGSIHVESLHGYGATFILSFPDPVIE